MTSGTVALRLRSVGRGGTGNVETSTDIVACTTRLTHYLYNLLIAAVRTSLRLLGEGASSPVRSGQLTGTACRNKLRACSFQPQWFLRAEFEITGTPKR